MASVTHRVTHTESGQWLHGPSTNFIFSFIENDMDEKVKQDNTKAYLDALQMSSKIKKAAKDITGKDVVNGLYIDNPTEMIKAMNSIEGMNQTATADWTGVATPVEINRKFFESILSGLGGDLAPIMKYLNVEMGKMQSQAKKRDVAENFGTIIGFVSLVPVLNIPAITFVYAYALAEEYEWFVNTSCGSTTYHSFKYKYTTVHYNYAKPAK